MNTSYSYNEFLAFVLIYASHVDLDYSEEEKDKIKSIVSISSYEKVYNDFINMSDYRSLQTIMDHKGLYFPTADRKEELLDKMKELFYADGDFSSIEKEMLHFLKKLL